MKAKELLSQLGVDEKNVLISEQITKSNINFKNGFKLEINERGYIFIELDNQYLCSFNQEHPKLIVMLKRLGIGEQKKEKA